MSSLCSLAKRLSDEQIGHAIYYPRSLHMQDCFAYLGHGEGSFPESERAAGEVLAIPLFGELGEERRTRVADVVIDALR